VALVEHGKGGVTVEVGGKNGAARLKLKKGDVAVEVQPGEGAGKLRVECPTRFIVLPDFFADDILIDARKLPARRPRSRAKISCFSSGEGRRHRDVGLREQGAGRAALAKRRGDDRVVAASEIEFGKNRKIWVSVLEAPQIWHVKELRPEDAEKSVPLDWKMPFRAAWRCDLTRSNDLADSWDMLLQKDKDGEYLKPAGWAAGPRSCPRRASAGPRCSAPSSTRCGPTRRRGFVQPLKHDRVSSAAPR
jgi:hypothetical protein